MAANGAPIRLQSHAQRPYRNRQTTSPSPAPSPRRGTTPTSSHSAVPVKEHPLLGPPRPHGVAGNSTPTGSWISHLLRTDKQQASITEEQNRRIAELEQSKKHLINIRTLLPHNVTKGERAPPVEIQIS